MNIFAWLFGAVGSVFTAVVAPLIYINYPMDENLVQRAIGFWAVGSIMLVGSFIHSWTRHGVTCDDE